MRPSSLSRLLRFSLSTALAVLFFVVLAPGCGRSSLEAESLDGGTVAPGTCNAQTCPTGCCDANGTCRLGSDTRACGSGGDRCSDCVATGFDTCGDTKTCSRNGCTNCNGCCDRSGGVEICRAGADTTACGRGGATCTDCSAEGRACSPQTGACGAGKCDQSNCTGCCVGDKCLAGTDTTACGQLGQSCSSCQARGQTCKASGFGGGTCQGTPACSPANCGGCCNGTTCLSGADLNACGKGGQACAVCPNNDVCVPTGQPNERTCQPLPTCNAATCPNGCCVGSACVTAETNAACGKGGGACVACGPNATCNAGTGKCEPQVTCNAATCPFCCIGNICSFDGSQNTACGLGGVACQNCLGKGQTCQTGLCKAPPCGPGNCPNGCCEAGVCVVGTQDNACGRAGAACSDCTAAGGQICQGRVCKPKCGPANCLGCCAAGNLCAPGFADNNCGAAGAACTNCTALGTTCDNLVTPPVCTNQQTKCPAPYGGCVPGVTTAVTPQHQGVCSDLDTAGLPTACRNGAKTPSCVAAIAAIKAVNAPCAACITPFNVDFFPTFEGLFLCVAPFVPATCNRSTGCDFDCTTKSCNQCTAANVDACETNVQDVGGQCETFANQSNCAANAVFPGQPGEFCDPQNYADYGSWLEAVAKHFCGP